MSDQTLTERAPDSSASSASAGGGFVSRIDAALGSPVAFVATALILLGLFAWPFLTQEGRLAPTKDPAFYTWRTEAFLTEEPKRVLEIEGPRGMFGAGYRVAGSTIAGVLRRIPAVSQLNVITFLMVGIPVLTALLLAGFAYRYRPDPLIFHSVAFATGGLYLTPPFVGYLDNVLCLLFLAASLFFLGPARDSWPSRLALGVCLLLAGLTHPTTLVIFCLVLGVMAALRLIVRRFDLRSVIRDDGPMLVTAFLAAVVTLLIWTVGIWGKSVSLAEAALLPPYGKDFFLDRMILWVKAMRPALNGPLLVIGVVGLLASGWKSFEDQLTRVSIAWLAPLVGLFGFLAGFAYTYYRFFNTTLAWVLLVGVGAFFAIRFFMNVAARGGTSVLALVGVLAIAFILATNFTKGFTVSGWTNPNNQWLSAQEQADLEALRAALATAPEDTPVVFVIDDEPPQPFQIYGFSKLSGNTSRYALPSGMIDRAHLCLGSVDDCMAGEPTTRGDATYDDLSRDLVEDTQKGIQESGQEPIYVVASAFNAAGANAEIATGEAPAPEGVWVVNEGEVQGAENVGTRLENGEAGPAHLLWLIVALAILAVPGYLALRGVLPDAGLAEALGLVPTLAAGLLAVAGLVVVALVRSPFTAVLAWATFIVACAFGAALGGRGFSGPRSADRPAAAA